MTGSLALSIPVGHKVHQGRVRETTTSAPIEEARNLGVEQILLDAGAHVAPAWMQYSERVDEPAMVPMSMMVEGIRAASTCVTLTPARLLSTRRRPLAQRWWGIHDVHMSAGQDVSVTYSSDRAGEVRARLVAGADGRSSTVRRQAGISLQRDDPANYITGLLVDGLAGIPTITT